MSALQPALPCAPVDDEPADRERGARCEQLGDEPAVDALTLEEILTVELTDEEVREIVCRYLHWRYGYRLTPPVLRPFCGSWEYTLRRRRGRAAIVRARRGFSVVSRDSTAIAAPAIERLIVFSPTATYAGGPDPDVTEIDYEEIADFVRTHPQVLPDAFAR